MRLSYRVADFDRLADIVVELGGTAGVEEAAKKLGISRRTLNGIVNGNPISVQTAAMLMDRDDRLKELIVGDLARKHEQEG